MQKKNKKTLTKQEKSRYNSALLKQNAQAYDAVRLHTAVEIETSFRFLLPFIL